MFICLSIVLMDICVKGFALKFLTHYFINTWGWIGTGLGCTSPTGHFVLDFQTISTDVFLLEVSGDNRLSADF